MKDSLDWIGCGISTVFTAVQTNQVFQTISLILTIIATLTTIVSHIIKWYKQAKKDGKITIDEVEDIVDQVNDDLKDIEKGAKK